MAGLSTHLLLFFFDFICHGYGSGSTDYIVSQPESMYTGSADKGFIQSTTSHAAPKRGNLGIGTPLRGAVQSLSSATYLENHDCRHFVSEIVYREDVCGAPDPQSYLEMSKPSYTCADRCGRAPVYGKSLPECGCDQKCVTYGDCCKDMDIICPELYQEGKRIKTQSLNGIVANCFTTSYKVLSKPASLGEYPQSTQFSSTIPTVRQPATEAARIHGRENNGSFFSPKMLYRYFAPFAEFKVADPLLGMLFEEYFAFMYYTPEPRTPYFVPKLASLRCSLPVLKGNGRYSILYVLNICEISHVEDAKTPLHRDCSHNRAILCSGGSCNDFVEYVHNACLGTNDSVPAISRFTWEEGGMQFIKASNQKAKGQRTCTFQVVARTGFKAATTSSAQSGYLFPGKMRLTVVYLRKTDIAQGAGEPTKASGEVRIPGLPVEEDGTKMSGEAKKFGFLVEMTGTVEKRLWCPSLNSLLTDCFLDECVRGAIFVNNTSAQSKYNFLGQTCIWPAKMAVLAAELDVRVPLCICFQVLVAVTKLSLWKVTLTSEILSNLQCVFQITAKEQEEEEEGLSQVDNLFATILTPSWITHDTPEFPKRSSFRDELQRKMNTITYTCPDETQEEVRICVYGPKEFHAPQVQGKSADLCATVSLPKPNRALPSKQRSRIIRLTFDSMILTSLALINFSFEG